MQTLKKHHINEVMDMHNLTRGKLGYSEVYYADDVDRRIKELEEEKRKLRKALYKACQRNTNDNTNEENTDSPR